MQGRRLRQLRKRAGLTQWKLAVLAELQPAHINKMENSDRSNPQLDTLEKLAVALECSVGDLLAEPDNDKEAAAG